MKANKNKRYNLFWQDTYESGFPQCLGNYDDEGVAFNTLDRLGDEAPSGFYYIFDNMINDEVYSIDYNLDDIRDSI